MEAATANLFLLTGDRLLTPPLSDGPLPGITRGVVGEIAPRIGLTVEERTLRPPDLAAADAVLLTSSIAGITPERVADATGAVVRNERLIKQIQFPKIILPTASTVAGIANFIFGLVALAGLLIVFYSDRASWHLVYIPVIAAVQFVFTLAFALVVSAVNVFFRDVANVSRHALRLWFYLSPALYSAEQALKIAGREPLVVVALVIGPPLAAVPVALAATWHGIVAAGAMRAATAAAEPPDEPPGTIVWLQGLRTGP